MAIPKIDLNTGDKIPQTGFGTWQLEPGPEAHDAVKHAISAGCRLIDTAKIYGNEQSVGEALKAGGVERRELFVTTKLWPSDFSRVQEAFRTSLDKLDLDYLDLYLIHWPNGSSRAEAWQELAEIHKQGTARAVGVSNYMVNHLEELFNESNLLPAVNQIEFHPFIYRRQEPVLELCRQKGIVVEAYSPLTVGRNLDHPTISKIAGRNGRTNAQVILRWCLQHGTVPIPRSTNPSHIKENLQIFDFELSEEDMRVMDSLSERSGWHPNEM